MLRQFYIMVGDNMTLTRQNEYEITIAHFNDLDYEITKTDRIVAISALRYILANDPLENEVEDV